MTLLRKRQAIVDTKRLHTPVYFEVSYVPTQGGDLVEHRDLSKHTLEGQKRAVN